MILQSYFRKVDTSRSKVLTKSDDHTLLFPIGTSPIFKMTESLSFNKVGYDYVQDLEGRARLYVNLEFDPPTNLALDSEVELEVGLDWIRSTIGTRNGRPVFKLDDIRGRRLIFTGYLQVPPAIAPSVLPRPSNAYLLGPPRAFCTGDLSGGSLYSGAPMTPSGTIREGTTRGMDRRPSVPSGIWGSQISGKVYFGEARTSSSCTPVDSVGIETVLCDGQVVTPHPNMGGYVTMGSRAFGQDTRSTSRGSVEPDLGLVLYKY